MNHLNQLTIFLLSIAFVMFLPLSAQAQSDVKAQQVPDCLELYNSGSSCQTAEGLTVDKKIQNPEDGQFVNTLEPNQTAIRPTNSVIFRVTVTNTSGDTFEGITLTDEFTDAITFTSSQQGTYNADNHTLTHTIESLESDASFTFDMQVAVKPENELPTRSGPLCVTNIAKAQVGDSVASDNVQFCIATAGTNQANGSNASFPTANTTPAPNGQTNGASTTKGGQTVHPAPESDTSPNTGPALLGIAGLLPALGAGFYLRRKATK